MSVVSEIIAKVGYRLFADSSQTIGTSTQPSTTEVLSVLNDGVRVLAQIFAEKQSEIGMTIARIQTVPCYLIESITQANPCVVTTTEDHGYAGTEVVWIQGANGMPQVNNKLYKITVIGTDSFSLRTNVAVPAAVDSTLYDEYSSQGIVTSKVCYTDLAGSILAPAPKALLYRDGGGTSEVLRAPYKAGANYGPMAYGPPEKFTLDESGNIYFLPGPSDDIYVVMFPYWAIPTALTLAPTDSTLPFGGIFDAQLVEGVANFFKNREEYDLNYDEAWRQFLLRKLGSLVIHRGATTGSLKG